MLAALEFRLQAATCHALMAYMYNTSGVQFALDIYGEEAHQEYLGEKADLYSKSPVRAIGYLDDAHFRKLTGVAWKRYGQEAARRFGAEWREQ